MENYVSFELAKKLKEKGFREECIRHYLRDNLLWNCMKVEPYYDKVNVSWAMHSFNEFSHDKTDAPSISQVLKWLREEKGLSVEPYSCACGWRVTICLTGNVLEGYVSGGTCVKDEIKGPNDGGAYDWFEQAALAGIEYVLDNLI